MQVRDDYSLANQQKNVREFITTLCSYYLISINYWILGSEGTKVMQLYPRLCNDNYYYYFVNSRTRM